MAEIQRSGDIKLKGKKKMRSIKILIITTFMIISLLYAFIPFLTYSEYSIIVYLLFTTIFLFSLYKFGHIRYFSQVLFSKNNAASIIYSAVIVYFSLLLLGIVVYDDNFFSLYVLLIFLGSGLLFLLLEWVATKIKNESFNFLLYLMMYVCTFFIVRYIFFLGFFWTV